MAFTGFPEAAFRFYEALAADNSKTFWQANRATYVTAVREPLDAVLAALDDHGPFHVFRPNRDLRFSKEKVPYKDHQGAYGESEGGAGFYLQVSANGLLVGTGYYAMASDQLERFRTSVTSDVLGPEIQAITDRLVARRYRIGAISELKTAPRGYPADHPRIALLRRKGLMATREWTVAPWMATRAVVTRIREVWDGAAEMNAWLDTHVGPSTLAPDDGAGRFGPF